MSREDGSTGTTIAASVSLSSSSSSSLPALSRSSSSSSPLPVLSFHQQILNELAADDALVILARGLGLPQLLYHLISQYASSSRLVFVLNVKVEIQREINERLSREEQSHIDLQQQKHNSDNKTDASDGSTTITTTAMDSRGLTSKLKRVGRLRQINNQITAIERQQMYLEGGCLAITNRILIVDLLNHLISPDLITGLIINEAHRINDTSNEAFILRVIRQTPNNIAFIKAFSDEPSAFNTGFFSLDKIMKYLYLKTLYLYPRFHLGVSTSLITHIAPPFLSSATNNTTPATSSTDKIYSPDIHEMYQPLTMLMSSIQQALIECLDIVISSLKAEHKLGGSITNITIENGLTKAFDLLIRQELQPVWHKVTPRSRQLVNDLTSLRQCLTYLINYDAVTFYRYLMTIRTQCQSSNHSLWLFTEPADRLFKLAKNRVYMFHSSLSKRTPSAGPSSLPTNVTTAIVSSVIARARQPVDANITRGKNRAASPNDSSDNTRRKRSSDRDTVVISDEEQEQHGPSPRPSPSPSPSPASSPSPAPSADSIELILEENPKWQLLSDILAEIAADVEKNHVDVSSSTTVQTATNEGVRYLSGRILVCCSEERTCGLLKRYLEIGGKKMMKQQWRRFLFTKRKKRRYQDYNNTNTSALTTPAINVNTDINIPVAIQPAVIPTSISLTDSAISEPVASASSTLSSALSPSLGAIPSQLALLAAENAALQAELEKLFEKSRDRKMKKFERERRRRLAAEEKAARTAIVGEDQITLTQHFRAAAEKKKQQESARVVQKKAANALAAKKKKKAQREKEKRLSGIERTEDDEDGVLRDVLMMREKRNKDIAGLSEDEDLDADEIEDDEDEDGTNVEERQDRERLRRIRGADDDWGILSVCDVELHIQQTQNNKSSPLSHYENASDTDGDIDIDGEINGDNGSATQTDTDVSILNTQAHFTDSIWHDFDETILHALPNFQIILHPSAEVNLMLYRFQPEFIIMFDPDLTLMREIEVFAASHPLIPIRVYFCLYQNSVEEQRYLTTIQQEKKAFDQLIFQRAHMVVPTDREGKSVGLSGANDTKRSSNTNPPSASSIAAMRAPRPSLEDDVDFRYSTYEAYKSTIVSKTSIINTRRGGDLGQQVAGKVIVDVREFRSSLPSLLHSRGLTIIPVTLEIGDYILSPHICVERKSLSDLFSSFLSGRLYRQMETLSRYYTAPILLIEWDQHKPFILLNRGELGTEINSKHIMSKIVLLCLHFPTIRIIWSRDSYMTSQIFLLLKASQPQPDVDNTGGVVTVRNIGISGSMIHNRLTNTLSGAKSNTSNKKGGYDEDDDNSGMTAMMPYDILRKLPGITAVNIRFLLEHVHTLKELCSKKLPELTVSMGEANARKLYHFLHADMGPLFTT